MIGFIDRNSNKLIHALIGQVVQTQIEGVVAAEDPLDLNIAHLAPAGIKLLPEPLLVEAMANRQPQAYGAPSAAHQFQHRLQNEAAWRNRFHVGIEMLIAGECQGEAILAKIGAQRFRQFHLSALSGSSNLRSLPAEEGLGELP
jgi:hypothetical protein